MAKFVEHNHEMFQLNDYMHGVCPGCGSWEAPITVRELVLLRDRSAHRGSSPRAVDSNAQYHRETWTEFFVCPRKDCQTPFGVPFSST